MFVGGRLGRELQTRNAATLSSRCARKYIDPTFKFIWLESHGRTFCDEAYARLGQPFYFRAEEIRSGAETDKLAGAISAAAFSVRVSIANSAEQRVSAIFISFTGRDARLITYTRQRIRNASKLSCRRLSAVSGVRR